MMPATTRAIGGEKPGGAIVVGHDAGGSVAIMAHFKGRFYWAFGADNDGQARGGSLDTISRVMIFAA
jgi:hypothetical protein